MTTEEFKKVLKYVPNGYLDRYGLLGDKGDKYVYVSTALSLMSELTGAEWKTDGNFRPVYNLFGMMIRDSSFKGFFEGESVNAVKNIYDLIHIQRENSFKYYSFLNEIKKNFIKDGNRIGGFIDFLKADGTRISLPVLFFEYTVLTNVTADKEKAKKIYKNFYDYAYKNFYLFPEDARPETFLDKRALTEVYNSIDNYFELIISMVKEKTAGLTKDVNGQLMVNRALADLILGADLEVINGKDNVFIGIKEFKNEQFEKFTFAESINPSVLSYIRKKYQNDKTFDAVFNIQKKIQANHDVFGGKNILIVSKENFSLVKKVIRGEITLPDQESVERKMKLYREKSTFSRFLEKDTDKKAYKRKTNGITR